MDQIARLKPAVASSQIIRPSTSKSMSSTELLPVPWAVRAYVFLKYLPRTVLYNSAQVAEQCALFFAIATALGVALHDFVADMQVKTKGEPISAAVLFAACVAAVGVLWIFQERLAIWAYQTKDPLTIKISWRKFTKRVKRLGSFRKGASTVFAPSTAQSKPTVTEASKVSHEAIKSEPVAEDEEEGDEDDEEEATEGSSQTAIPLVEELPKTIAPKLRTFTPAQEEAIHTLRMKYFDPKSEIWSKSRMICVNDDGRAAAIRALDARRFKVDQASILIENNLKWREKEGIDNIFSKVVPDKDTRIIRVAMGDGFFGQDRTGMPIYWCPAGTVNLGTLNKEVPLENLVLVHVQQMEYNQRVWYHELSKQQNRCIYQATCVLDLKGFSSQATSGSFWDVMQTVGAIDKDYYYENLHKVYILHAPMFFRFFWNTVSQLLQPETREKFIFLADTKGLHEFIDPDIIPKRFGGNYEKEDVVFTAETVETQHSKRFDQFLREYRGGKQQH